MKPHHVSFRCTARAADIRSALECLSPDDLTVRPVRGSGRPRNTGDGEAFRSAHARSGLSTAEFADLIGVSAQSARSILAGERNPSIQLVRTALAAFPVDLAPVR